MKKGLAAVWIILLTVIIMAGLGTGGWYYLNGKFDQQKEEKDGQIAILQKELKDLASAEDAQDKAAQDASNTSSSGVSSTGTSTASSFNTYTSTTYGYRFQYPKTMSLVDWFWNGATSARVPQNGKVVWLSKMALTERAIPMDADPISSYLSFSINEEMCGLSAIRGDGSNIIIEDTALDGNAAWKAKRTSQDDFGGQFNTIFYANHGSYCYQIIIANSDAAGTHDPQIDAIVSSFKFL